MYGGRVECAIALIELTDEMINEGYKIGYLDFTSLYPSVREIVKNNTFLKNVIFLGHVRGTLPSWLVVRYTELIALFNVTFRKTHNIQSDRSSKFWSFHEFRRY